MTWSYSGDPATSPIDAIRLEIGDTVEEEQLLSDEEINYLYQESGKRVFAAAARACDILASKFAREADVSVGGMRVQWRDQAEAYAALAQKIRQKIRGRIPTDATTKERDPLFYINQFTKNRRRRSHDD